MFAIPILFEDTLLGVLTLCGQQPFYFGPDDRDLLDSFVAQAAVAIRNARLYQEAEKRQQRLETLVAVAQRLTRGLDLPTVLNAIAEATALVFEGEAGFRVLEGELVRVGATPGALEAMRRSAYQSGNPSAGVWRRVAKPSSPRILRLRSGSSPNTGQRLRGSGLVP